MNNTVIDPPVRLLSLLSRADKVYLKQGQVTVRLRYVSNSKRTIRFQSTMGKSASQGLNIPPAFEVVNVEVSNFWRGEVVVYDLETNAQRRLYLVVESPLTLAEES